MRAESGGGGGDGDGDDDGEEDDDDEVTLSPSAFASLLAHADVVAQTLSPSAKAKAEPSGLRSAPSAQWEVESLDEEPLSATFGDHVGKGGRIKIIGGPGRGISKLFNNQ